MNWFDRAIAAVNPEAGMRRARARAALRVIDSALKTRAYDAAKRGRRTQGWMAQADSPNSSVVRDMDTLRARSHDLVANNSHARKAISTLQRHMVRSGIQAVWDNKAASKAWRSWCKRADWREQTSFAGLQAQIVRCWEESGEVLIRRRVLSTAMMRGGLLNVPLQLEVLEPDLLAGWKTQQLADGFIIAGVEFDLAGKRRAYWLYPTHPGETLPLRMNLTPVRVPAEDIIHAYSMVLGRPGQVRGVPALAASMLRLRDWDEYMEAMLVRKKIEACFAVFITSPGGNAPGIPGVTQSVDSSTGIKIDTLAPGMIQQLSHDQDVKFAEPDATQGDGYSTDELHAIAAGAEVTYEQLTGDLSRVNYSSMRAGKLEFFALIDMKQQLEFIPQVCNPIARWWSQLAYVSGAVRARDLEPIDWTCPKPEFTDPLKDALALKELIRGGMMSRREGTRLAGYDPETVFEETVEEQKEAKAASVVFDTDASVATLKKGAAGGGSADSATDAGGNQEN